MTMLATFGFPMSFAVSVTGTSIIRISVRAGFVVTMDEFTIINPPGKSSSRNLSTDGSLNAISVEGRLIMGEAMLWRESLTWQWAVPPRISGP